MEEAFLETYRDILRKELANRIANNRNYSLRAFARSLKINVGTLSSVLNNKRCLTLKSAYLILPQLSLSPQKRKTFLDSIYNEQKSRLVQKVSKDVKNYPYFDQAQKKEKEEKELEAEIFKIIGEWIHVAILELTFLPGCEDSPVWIAKKLGITQIEAKLALERLIRLGLLERVDGSLVKTNKKLSVKDKDVTTPALKKLQKDFLKMAIESINCDSIENRCAEGMTMSIDPRKLPMAKKMIVNFMSNLCDYLEDGAQTKLYQLNTVLFELGVKG